MRNYQENGSNRNYYSPIQADRGQFDNNVYHFASRKHTLPETKEAAALSTANDLMANVYRSIGVDEDTIAKMMPQPGTKEARSFIEAAADLSGREIPVFVPKWKKP